MNIDIGLALLVGAGMGVSVCKAHDGKRFLAIGPEIALGSSVMLVSVSFERIHYSIKNSNSNIFTHKELNEIGAIGLSFVNETPYPFGQVMQGDVTEGVGIGLGMAASERHAIEFKILPLPRDNDELLKGL